jgi:hypothetical protein
MCRWLFAAAVAVVVFAQAPAVRADALADARKAVEGSDYPNAKTALDAALKAGTAGPGELAEIYKLSGIVDGALNNTQAATAWFAKWLSLDPKASLPFGTSPRILKPFESAQAQAKKKGALEVKSETEDDPPAVTLVVINDPYKIIAGAKVHFRVDKRAEQTLSADGTGRIKLELETGKRIDLRLHAVDRYGNSVVELGTRDVPLVITSTGKPKSVIDPDDANLVKKPPPSTPDAPAEPRPWYAQWWVWGIATGVTGVATGYFGWRTRSEIGDLDRLNANSYAHTWSEAQDVERRAKRDMLITNIGLGVTGAFAIGTAILYLTRPDARSEATEPRAAITPIPGGGAVVLGGQF